MAEFKYNKSDLSYAVLDERKTQFLKQVDEYFRNVTLTMGAEEIHIPSLLNLDVLRRCGYLESFPHHLTIPTYLKKAEFDRSDKNVEIDNSRIEVSDRCLTPAACLHIYPYLEGKKIRDKIITTRASVYRHEDEAYDEKVRLWNFHVREIVFVGSRQFVKGKLEEFSAISLSYAKKIGVDAHLIDAHDNFHPTKRNDIKKRLQEQNFVKKELSVSIRGNNAAIASFNYHDTHFSAPFNFSENSRIVTGCVGFGLERWVAAIDKREGRE